MDVRFALAILFLVNVANYVARNVLGALLPLVQKEFAASDALAGLLGSALMWTYLLSALVLGPLADRTRRNRIVGWGAIVWSIGASGGALATGLASLFAWRGVVGAGEAAFSSAAPVMIADYYPPQQRNRALTYFYIAMPVGAGLGFALGGVLGQAFGWRAALALTGSPGLLLGALAMALREPVRGGLDSTRPEPPQKVFVAARRLWLIASFRWLVAGYALLTFALGAVAAWLPTFLVRAHGMSVEEAGILSGGSLVVGSLIGTVFGGFVADLWNRRSRNALVYTSASGLVLAALLTPLFFLARQREGLFALLTVINFFLFWHTGPLNAALTNIVPPSIRATSVAVQILAIHLLGDVASPGLLGAVSDFLQTRALPTAEALRWALLASIPPVLVLAALAMQIATRWLPADLAAVVGPHRRGRAG